MKLPCTIPGVMYNGVFKPLLAMAFLSALLVACHARRPSTYNSSSVQLVNGLFPVTGQPPCPCLVDGNNRSAILKAVVALRQFPILNETLLMPSRMKSRRACQDVISVYPYSWTHDQGRNSSNMSSAAARAKSLTQELMTGCKDTCAVVGSSIRLRGAGHGPEIDRVDIVIRMNNAPVKGYEADVGSRTSLRLISPDNLMTFLSKAVDNATLREELAPDLYAIRCLSLQCHVMLRTLSTQGLPPDGLMRVSRKHFFKLMHTEADRMVQFNLPAIIPILGSMGSRGKPTTGSMATIMSFLFCRKVLLYGFGDETFPQYGHYYGNDAVDKLPTVASSAKPPDVVWRHDVLAEWKYWKALGDAGLITRIP
eukprot:jgi/Mesvir1/7344/Mv25800-RA.1